MSSVTVLAIPAQKLREELIEWKPLMAEDATYISSLKGIEMSTLKRMTEVITEITGSEKVAIITGPNLARELILRQPAGAVAAAHGADPLSAAGLAGMGDLVASCGSPLSRNRTFGEILGRTGSMEQARIHVSKTVEGVDSSSAIVEIAHRVGIEVPVIEAVADVVTGTITPVEALQRLMAITTKAENFIR